jgi:signal transduction histidine kinase
MTTWFRILSSLAIVGLVVATHRVRTSALERRNRELLRLKEERERALEEARASQEELHHAYERLRRLTRRLELAKEEERKRIARELHDEMGQALTAAKINMQLLAQDPTRDNAPARIEDTVGLVDRMIGHVRTLSLDLRPPLLDELGLGAALRGYLEAQAQRSGLDVRVDADSIPPGVPPEVEITTFRTVQEAVTNILRHANAKHVDVRIRRTDGTLDISIRDDGAGFDVDRTIEKALGGHHLGLLGIRERVQVLGGSVAIESEIGVGTEVRVSVPMNP